MPKVLQKVKEDRIHPEILKIQKKCKHYYPSRETDDISIGEKSCTGWAIDGSHGQKENMPYCDATTVCLHCLARVRGYWYRGGFHYQLPQPYQKGPF